MSENVVEGINNASTLEDLIAKYDEAMKGKGEFTEQLEAFIDIKTAFIAKLGAFYVDKDSGLSSMSEEALKKMAEKGGTSAEIASIIQKRQKKDRNPHSNRIRPDKIEQRSGYKNENEARPQRESFMSRLKRSLKQRHTEAMQKLEKLFGGKRGGEVGGLTGGQNSVQQGENIDSERAKYIRGLRTSGSKPTTPREEQGAVEKPRSNNQQGPNNPLRSSLGGGRGM